MSDAIELDQVIVNLQSTLRCCVKSKRRYPGTVQGCEHCSMLIREAKKILNQIQTKPL